MPMSGYDNRTAIFLASVCSQAYTHYNDPNGQFIIPDPFEWVSDIRALSLNDKAEKFGFIIQSSSEVVVAFRGTSSAADWASDAMASQARYKCAKNAGQTHRGISNIYYSARENIITALCKLSASKSLFITGHSLGGALATLCALDVATNTEFTAPIVYTFGSPRVGNLTFSRAFQDKIGQSFRIHNRFDVVTHLPPQVYQVPKSNKTYYYEHVQISEALSFHNGSIPGNHVIGSYFQQLTKRDPLYTEQLSARNPGFCPDSIRIPYTGDRKTNYDVQVRSHLHEIEP